VLRVPRADSGVPLGRVKPLHPEIFLQGTFAFARFGLSMNQGELCLELPKRFRLR